MAPKGLGKILITPVTDAARFAHATGKDWKHATSEAINKELAPIKDALTPEERRKVAGRLYHAAASMLEKDKARYRGAPTTPTRGKP